MILQLFTLERFGEEMMKVLFEKLDGLKPLYDAIYKALAVLCKILLIADILIAAFQVLGRYIPFIPDPKWTEQVILTLMAYMAVLSAALAIRKKSHIRMTAFDRYLSPLTIRILDLISDISVMILSLIMIIEGWKYAVMIGNKGVYESMPWLSRFWMYFPVALAGIAMFVFELEAIYDHTKSFVIPEKEDK